MIVKDMGISTSGVGATRRAARLRAGLTQRALAALGIIEEVGFGVDRMVAAMRDDGLPSPQFRETEGTFVVTLRGHGAGLLTESGRETERVASPQAEMPGRRRLSPDEWQV